MGVAGGYGQSKAAFDISEARKPTHFNCGQGTGSALK
jgi:hypothetical protein